MLTVEFRYRLEGQDRGQARQLAVAGGAGDLVLQDLRQPVRLHRRVDRERVILERIEFGQNVEPGGLGEAGQIGGQGRKSGEAGETGDADHRRYENQAIGAFQPVVAERVERVFERQRAAVGVADEMQRLAGAGAPAAFSDRKAGRRHPVLPFDRGEPARNRAVARKPHADRDKAVRAIELGDMTQAERRVGQPVQEDDRAGRLAFEARG